MNRADLHLHIKYVLIPVSRLDGVVCTTHSTDSPTSTPASPASSQNSSWRCHAVFLFIYILILQARRSTPCQGKDSLKNKSIDILFSIKLNNPVS